MRSFFRVMFLTLVIGSVSLVAGGFGGSFGGKHFGFNYWSDQPEHYIVVHVDRNDPLTQKLALNNVANVVKYYGKDNVKIEVVAYGPGLQLLVKGTPNADRVLTLAQEENIRFSACNNTIQAIKRKTGEEPDLIDGVIVVPSGVVRITELEEDGYTYIRP